MEFYFAEIQVLTSDLKMTFEETVEYTDLPKKKTFYFNGLYCNHISPSFSLL